MTSLHMLSGMLCSFFLPLASVAAASPILPCCRKSPELHQLRWPDGSARIVSFGGKGFEWERKPSKVGKKPKQLKKKVRFFADTWAFDVADREWTLLAGGANSARPQHRWKPSSTTFDDESGLILFGGCKSTSPKGVLNDLWALRPHALGHATWTRIYTAEPPAKRRGHIVAATSSHLIVIGGKSWTGIGKQTRVLVDVWSLSLSIIRKAAGPNATQHLGRTAAREEHGDWHQGMDFPGEARWGSTGTRIRAPDGQEFIACFGGRIKNVRPDLPEYTYFNELWLYDFAADFWRQAHPGGTGAPHPRDHHGATALGGDLYVFGGRVSPEKRADSVTADLWRFSLAENAWRLVAATSDTGPSRRYMPGVATIALTSAVNAVAVFGGEMLPGSTKKASLNDLWLFSQEEETWQLLSRLQCSAAATTCAGLECSGKPNSDSGVRGGQLFARWNAFFGCLALFGGAALAIVAWRTPCRGATAARGVTIAGTAQPNDLQAPFLPLD